MPPSPSLPSMKTHPYTIHHSYSPSAILVTPLLTGDNYGSWSHKLGFVDGSLPIPKEKDEISNLDPCNDLIESWILNSLSPKICDFYISPIPRILYAETATQIFSALKQEGMHVSLYFTQLKFLWDELSSIICITPCICALQASKPLSWPSGKLQCLFCKHCNKHGHTLKSRPPPSTSATLASQLTPKQYNKLLALLAKEESRPSNEEED
ncbi:hypothetical protein Pfo_006800 [Paulownia fortunei]|nr:hypothetical protein Pfo_006800 [Paulownia fortunei]